MQFAKSILATAASNHIETLLALFTSAIAARTLGANDYGSYAWVLTWVTLGQSFANSGITTTLQRFIAQTYHKDGQNQAPAIAAYIRRLQFRQIAVVALIVAASLAATIPSHLREEKLAIIAIVTTGIAFRSLYLFSASACKGAGAFTSAAIITTSGSVINLVTTSVAAITSPSIVGFLSAYLIAAGGFCFSSIIVSRSLFARRNDNASPPAPAVYGDIRRTLLYLTPSALISQAAGAQLDLLLLGSLASQQDVGYFRIGLTLASGTIAAASGALAAITLPYISAAIKEGNKSGAAAFERINRYFILLAAPVAGATVALSPVLVEFLYGPAFSGAALALAVLTIPICIAELNTPAQAVLIGAGRQKQLLAISTANLSIKICAGALLIMQFGLAGALLSYSASSIIVSSAKSFIARRILELPPPRRIQAVCALTSTILAIPSYAISSRTNSLAIALLVSTVFFGIYTISILYFRCLNASEIERIKLAVAHLPHPLRMATSFLIKRARPMKDTRNE